MQELLLGEMALEGLLQLRGGSLQLFLARLGFAFTHLQAFLRLGSTVEGRRQNTEPRERGGVDARETAGRRQGGTDLAGNVAELT